MTSDNLDDVLDALQDAFRETDAPVVGTRAVADRLDRERRRVYDDLVLLERAGDVDSYSPHSKARVWWPAPHPWQASAAASGPPAPTADESPTRTDERDDAVAGRSDGAQTLAALAHDAHVPGAGAGDTAQQRHQSLQAVLEELRDRGAATRGELQDDVFPDHSAGYETPNSWWKNCIRPALAELADRDDRLQRADGRSPWRWQE